MPNLVGFCVHRYIIYIQLSQQRRSKLEIKMDMSDRDIYIMCFY